MVDEDGDDGEVTAAVFSVGEGSMTMAEKKTEGKVIDLMEALKASLKGEYVAGESDF